MLPAQTLAAPPGWSAVECISDLHLQASEPQTLAAWQRYLHASRASAIFILGDLLEAWVGDDALQEPGSFEAACAATLRMASQQRPIYFMVGNRDFLAGADFLHASGVQGLADPTLFVWGQQRILLSHGDALCLDDVEYQQFRAVSRNPAWQQQLLAQPLAARRALARQVRGESEQRKQSGTEYADADAALVRHWLAQTQAHTLIHGHTHRPADHALPDGKTRVVLSDWHCDGSVPRAEVLRITPDGQWQRIPLTDYF